MADETWNCASCGVAWSTALSACPDDGTLQRARRVGEYRLEARLGTGTSGETYRAVALDEGAEPVAVKLVAPGIDLHRNFTARTLTHEHLVTLRTVGRTDDGGTYLVSDLVDGVTLAALVAERPLGTVAAAELGRQIAVALAFLHERGLIHGHLTANNVLVEKRGGALVARLTDVALITSAATLAIARDPRYAFAKAPTLELQAPRPAPAGGRKPTLEELDAPVARLAIAVGAALPYVAPEQFADATPSPQADVYALGALLEQLALGRPPFAVPGRAGVMPDVEAWRRAHEEGPLPLPALPDGAPHPLHTVVLRCMARLPEARLSAGEIAEELATLATLHGRPPARPKLPQKTMTGVPAPSAAVALAALQHPGRERAVLPSLAEIEKRLCAALDAMGCGDAVPFIAPGMAAALRHAVDAARELEHLVVEGAAIDARAARDCFRRLRLGADTYERLIAPYVDKA